MGTSGKAGNIKGKKRRRRQLLRRPAPPRVPAPAAALERLDAAHVDAAKALGMHPFPGPAAIRSRDYHGLPACEYCGFCTYNGCMADAKGATDVGAIAEAEKTKRLKILTRRARDEDRGRRATAGRPARRSCAAGRRTSSRRTW